MKQLFPIFISIIAAITVTISIIIQKKAEGEITAHKKTFFI